MSRILVTGGAGYIGSVCARRLVQAGYEVRVLDDLSLGHAEAVHRAGAELVVGSVLDREAVRAALEGVQAVLHFAGVSQVGESVQQPERYHRVNAVGTATLASAMRNAGVEVLVFSSTAAVYGIPSRVPVAETHPLRPCNPYGASKVAAEQEALASGRRLASLRYFNACGATEDGQLGEAHNPETHLIPRLLELASKGMPLTIYGTDYETPDGTCVRDYLHVEDLADAHLAALAALMDGWDGGAVNLGTGQGHSVRAVVSAVQSVLGPVAVQEQGRRPGDPDVLVADTSKALATLGWQARRTLAQAVRDAWVWHLNQPY